MRRPIAELATILAEEGHTITVIYPYSKKCPIKNWVANEAIEKGQTEGRIKAVPVNSWYFAPLRYNFPNFFSVIREVQKAYRENDKVHIWEYYYPLSAVALFWAALSSKRRKKTILTTDGFVGYSYRPKKPRWLVPVFKVYTQLVARFLLKIPAIMTTYGEVMRPYARQAGVNLNKLQVLPTGIHVEKFQQISEEKLKKLRQEFNLSEEKVVLFVGMLTERKGVDKVIAVSTKLLEDGQDIKIILVGDAHGENTFRNLVPEEHKENIIFAGGRKDIPELMHVSTVLLLPSEGEGLPGVVMEAMACGLPVVATQEGCTSDLLEDGKEGFLIKNTTVNEYYEAVKTIITQPKMAEQMSKKGREKINAFSWEKVSRTYLKLYHE